MYLAALALVLGLVASGVESRAYKRDTSNFIVGGDDAEITELCYQVALLSSGGQQFCGGTLIGTSVVMTAAHCTIDASAGNVQIGVGSNKIDSNMKKYKLTAIKNHPQYNDNTMANDISLLILEKPVDCGAGVCTTTCLSEANCGGKDEMATVSGWGTLSSGGSSPDHLQKVDVKVYGTSECENAYSGEILSGMICAASPGKDSCQGDSGGPLAVKKGEKYNVCGVVSWGKGCAAAGNPGVYTDCQVYDSWVKANAGSLEQCGSSSGGGGGGDGGEGGGGGGDGATESSYTDSTDTF